MIELFTQATGRTLACWHNGAAKKDIADNGETIGWKQRHAVSHFRRYGAWGQGFSSPPPRFEPLQARRQIVEIVQRHGFEPAVLIVLFAGDWPALLGMRGVELILVVVGQRWRRSIAVNGLSRDNGHILFMGIDRSPGGRRWTGGVLGARNGRVFSWRFGPLPGQWPIRLGSLWR